MLTNLYAKLINETRRKSVGLRFINRLQKRMLREEDDSVPMPDPTPPPAVDDGVDDGIDWYAIHEKQRHLQKLPKGSPEAQAIIDELKQIPDVMPKLRKWRETKGPGATATTFKSISPVNKIDPKKVKKVTKAEVAQASEDQDPKNSKYMEALHEFTAQLKHGKYVNDLAVDKTAVELGNEFLQIINDNTSAHENSQSAAARNRKAILSMFGVIPKTKSETATMMIPPNAVPRMGEEKAKADLLKFAMSQILVGQGLGTLKSGNPNSHTAPQFPDQTPQAKPPSSESAPSLPAMELIGTTDPNVFVDICESLGLRILGYQNTDPLITAGLNEEIEAFASEITEDANDFFETDPYLKSLKELAEVLGYIVAYA